MTGGGCRRGLTWPRSCKSRLRSVRSLAFRLSHALSAVTYCRETIGKVAIINRQAYPLSRQLDDDGGEIVLRRIEAMGVDVLTKASVKDLVITPEGVLSGLVLSDDTQLDTQMVIYAIGITPRDDLARKAGLKCGDKGGITVDDSLKTSAPDVYAIGECASWRENTFGLIGPGGTCNYYCGVTVDSHPTVEMADILTFNLTQVETDLGGFKPRKMVCYPHPVRRGINLTEPFVRTCLICLRS